MWSYGQPTQGHNEDGTDLLPNCKLQDTSPGESWLLGRASLPLKASGYSCLLLLSESPTLNGYASRPLPGRKRKPFLCLTPQISYYYDVWYACLEITSQPVIFLAFLSSLRLMRHSVSTIQGGQQLSTNTGVDFWPPYVCTHGHRYLDTLVLLSHTPNITIKLKQRRKLNNIMTNITQIICLGKDTMDLFVWFSLELSASRIPSVCGAGN